MGLADSLAYKGKVNRTYGPFKGNNVLIKILAKLPTSDVDYFGVFVAPDALKVKAKTLDHSVAGNAGDDWVLYELGMYIELLAKGNQKSSSRSMRRAIVGRRRCGTVW